MVTVRALNRATLARQLLLERAAMAAPAVVEHLVGLQAQLPKPPFVGLWTRLEAFRREDLARRIHDRSIVRATFLRGTLHLVSARDFAKLRGPLQPALSAGLRAVLKGRVDALDMPAVLSEARRFFGRSPHTFDALRDHFEQTGVADVRGAAYAARLGLPLAQVPSDASWGFAATSEFSLAETWIGRAIDDATDARPLVRRYLAAFGPAGVTDMQTWSGHKGLKDAVESLRPELVTLAGDGRR
ncbi:MAG: winged helix DNA-binding domain-containing protein, partial [Polyangiaceae bacterium]|nr:winged helix DNA-binding domain-containing protein [Polyangiaceae bacterium]